jgi:disintegrin/metalloproteinase domain-containing protein 19
MRLFIFTLLVVAAFAKRPHARVESLLSVTDGIANPILAKLKSYELATPTLQNEGARLMSVGGESFPSSLSFSISAYGKEFQLDMTKNAGLLSPDYAEIRMDYGADGTVPGVEVSRRKPASQEAHCFFHGQVRGDQTSSVALSVCAGLRGTVQAHGESFSIEPAVFAHPTASAQAISASGRRAMPAMHVTSIDRPTFALHQLDTVAHVVYRDEDIDGHDASWTCGVRNSHVEQEIKARVARSVPRVQAAGSETIELLSFNDNARYRAKGEGVEHDTLTLMNMASSYYAGTQFTKPLHLVLIGQITFVQGDPYVKNQGASGIEVENSNGLLNTFNTWRLNPSSGLPRHDSGQLLSGEQFTSGIRGLAGVGVMCNGHDSGSITQMTSPSMRTNAMIAAHETGHTLSMLHDSIGNQCAPSGFIMATVTGTATQFSDCSIQYANNFLTTRDPQCLDNSVEVNQPRRAVERSTGSTEHVRAEEEQEPIVPIDYVGVSSQSRSPAETFLATYAPAFAIGVCFGAVFTAVVAVLIIHLRKPEEPLMRAPIRSDSSMSELGQRQVQV